MSNIVRLLRVAAAFVVFSSATAYSQYAKPTCPSGRNTTTISGVVYSPNGQDPLPDVLVYVPGAAGAVVIPDGVTTADLRPVSPLTQTTTAYDGSYTLVDAPAGTSVPIVIQSGKWQRQLVIASVTACQDNVPPDPSGDKFTRFPKNQSEGYIPRIGIVTGSKEATECVIRKVGLDDAEFTDSSGTGRINLFVGSKSGGSRIDSNTPDELTLVNDATQVNRLDMILFPCQGSDQTTTTAGQNNLASFANSGGRLFINHHSHAWLKNNTGFANTFNWGSDSASAPNGTGTIDEGFTIGVTLTNWLQNLGQTTTPGQVAISTVFASLASITTNAQLWITLNSNSLPVQASFDTPVGAGVGNTYGRVLYNEYHVSPASSSGTTFPNECSGTSMSEQEKVLEFSLFDLSSFAAITKIDPDMTLTGAPSPAKYNTSVTMTATLAVPTGSSSTYTTPTGSVTFSEGSTTYGTSVLHAGVATTVLTGLTAGTHTITAAYSGDPYYNSRTVTATIEVYPPATVTVVANPNPVYTGHTSVITFNATGSSTSPTPTGSVAITVDGVTTSYTLSGGSASTAPKVYANGQHVITAVYSGDGNYDTQTATTTLYVQVASTATLVESAPNVFLSNPAIFTATANGASDVVPSGTMSFYEGSTLLAAVPMSNGSAVLPTTSLAFGQHTINVSYSGDDYYGPSVSSSVVENVMDYQLTITQGSETILHSTTATFTFSITPLGGTAMPSNISLSVAGMRALSVLTMSPTVVATGAGTTQVTVTIKTSVAPTAVSMVKPVLRSGAEGIALALLALPFLGRRRRISRLLLIALAATTLSVGMTGCGTGWNTITYPLTLNASSGNLVHSGPLTLVELGGK